MLFDIHKPQEQPAGNRSPLVRTQLARVLIRYVCVELAFLFSPAAISSVKPSRDAWFALHLQVLGAAETSRRSTSYGVALTS